MTPIIEVRGLTKKFSEITAVDDLTFTVNKGEVYGFLGENGAGKSTTIRMLLSLIIPSSGNIKIFGLDLKNNRKEILKKTGAIIEKPDLYKYLTAYENLKLFSILSGLKPHEKFLMNKLDMVGLTDRADSKVKTYSQGMKQRLGIAVALINDPDLVILDEPLNGLDPQGIADIRKLISHLSKDQGKSIFISSHLLSEMEQVADSLLIIHKGKKIVEGGMKELLNPGKQSIEIETNNTLLLLTNLKNSSSWNEKIQSSNEKIVTLKLSKEDIPILIDQIIKWDIQLYSLNRRNTLEEYFLSLTTK